MASAVRTRSGRGPDGTWEIAFARPHPRLRPGVLGYRGTRIDMAGPRRRLEAPIGAVTLLLDLEGRVRISAPGREPVTLASLYSGMTTGAVVGEHGGRLTGIEVLLTPWAAFGMFGTPQHELAGRPVDPDELPHALGARANARRWHDVAGLSDALAALPGWPARMRLLDDVLTYWTGAGGRSSARVVRAWSELTRTGGTLPVPRLAAEVGWSVRQLESRFREQIGLGPKAAARVLRLQRARRLLAAGRGQAETAALCGYYDQAHLGREFRAMTGCTPGEFATARTAAAAPPAPSALPATDRMAGEATSLVLT
ncbi:helix-turn-helix domain-containing protein [Streptomyces sp. NPDC008150]|uniref:helix-turn-helix domain-containing protein n=1 Tax=Streptomyces sp. NPDC008150 TaxID=3364816 RepID=UPI0036E01123